MKSLRSVINSTRAVWLYWFIIAVLAFTITLWQVQRRSLLETEFLLYMNDITGSLYSSFFIELGAMEDLIRVPEGRDKVQLSRIMAKRKAFWKTRSREPELWGDHLIWLENVPFRFAEDGLEPAPDGIGGVSAGTVGICSEELAEGYNISLLALIEDRLFLILPPEYNEPLQAVLVDRDIFLYSLVPRLLDDFLEITALPEKDIIPGIVSYTGDNRKVLYSGGEDVEKLDEIFIGPVTSVSELYAPDSGRDVEDPPFSEHELDELELVSSDNLFLWSSRDKMRELYDSAENMSEYVEFNTRFWLDSMPPDEEIWGLVLFIRDGVLQAYTLFLTLPVLILAYLALGALGAAVTALTRYNREYRKLLVRQEEFVAAMTHELRTPLHAITGGAANLADGIVSTAEDVSRYGRMILKEGERLMEMVESILNYSGMGGTPAAYSSIDVYPLIGKVMEPYNRLCREKSVELIMDLGNNLSCRGDERALGIIISNLVSNALKHGGDGKHLRLAVHRWENLVITVEDKGKGMDKAQLEKAGEPFYRGDNNVAGSGLGLSIVKGLVAKAGGEMHITSIPGEGTSVTVHLPWGEEGEDGGVRHE